MSGVTAIDEELRNLTAVLSELKQKRMQIYHAKAESRRESFKDSLLSLKSNLMQLRQRLNSLGQQYSGTPTSKIDDICAEIDDLHGNHKDLPLEALRERIDIVKRLVASLYGFLPVTLLELEVNEEIIRQLPQDVREEIREDFAEIKKCYSAQAYRASIAFCGRVLETALAWKYYEVKKKSNPNLTPKDIENEIANLSFGKIIEKCRDVGLLANQPGVESYADLINRVRILSIHHKGSKYVPGPDAVRGTVSFMSEVIRELYS